ncbi:MAG: helix-turn-helix transcriptional regulator [Rhizobiaceae bacterium]
MKSARRARGLSQSDLANIMAVSQSRISAWENGYDDIPYRQRLKLIDVLTNTRGILNPLIEQMIKNDPTVVIYVQNSEHDLTDTRYLHVPRGLAAQFFQPGTVFDNQRVSHFGQSGLREIEYGLIAMKLGRKITPDLISMDIERDLPSPQTGQKRNSLRLRSHQFSLQFDGYPKIIVSRQQIVGPAKGEMQRLNYQTFLGDLDRL